MPTNRSRKSSTASMHHLPPTLRHSRPRSNTKLSLVIAEGTPEFQGLNAQNTESESERALSRQLDGDLGGRQMGLRSRENSCDTVNTVGTFKRSTNERTGKSSGSAPKLEEPPSLNGSSSLAGPLDTSPTVCDVASGPSSSTTIVDLPHNTKRSNVDTTTSKSSGSWLGWTNPGSKNDRANVGSKIKGKGKEREANAIGHDTGPPAIEHPIKSSLVSDAGKKSTDSDAILNIAVSKTLSPPVPSSAGRQPCNPNDSIAPSKVNESPDPPLLLNKTTNDQKGKSTMGWWHTLSKNTRVQTFDSTVVNTKTVEKSVSNGVPTESTASIINTMPEDVPTSEVKSYLNATSIPFQSVAKNDAAIVGYVDQSGQALSSKSSNIPPSNPPESSESLKADNNSWSEPSSEAVRANGKEIEERQLQKQKPRSEAQMAGTELTRSWRTWWFSPQSPSESLASATGQHTTQPLVPTESVSITSLKPEETHKPAKKEDNLSNSLTPDGMHTKKANISWGSHLYSYIVPTIKTTPPSIDHENKHVEHSSALDQELNLPLKTSPEPILQTALLSQPSDLSLTRYSTSPSRGDHAVHPDVPINGTRSSTAGWLNYLALRASQKRTNASSVLETENSEEVMDLSVDPNFPLSYTPHTIPDEAKVAPSTTVAVPCSERNTESIKSVAPKVSQNLDVGRKRLSSVGSVSDTLTPSSASPNSKPGDKAGSGKGGKDNVISHRGLQLQPRPNFVTPTFEATFDRPPRSLPPVPSSPTETNSTASNLAWKALSSISNYMYSDQAKATFTSIEENEPETRGKKEGRNVGADLPRRIGLVNGDREDGWKNVKRVVVVGVHGWFPAKMLNSVIGEPTGTSMKFATMMGQAVKQFFEERGVSVGGEGVRLTLMPLEGEGTIESRVDRLFKAYLSNPAWINDLRRADAIFFAAHSQGCIVTTHLISRLIAQGHIRTHLNAEAVGRCEWAFGPISVIPSSPLRGRKSNLSSLPGSDGGYQKVALLAMCGVHLGPLYSISTSTVIQPYLQWFENAATRELFEFQDTGSAVSQAYQRAMRMILENEVRIVLLASLNDQVVPIYGASFSTATHPLLLRALYIDGASYTQGDFMINLLSFAFMLRNAGIDDQHLVEHLSEATAGSLTGVGHSTPYEELSCYILAVKYLFYAGPVQHPIPELQVESFSARNAKNDYELPWIMRALVDSPEVKDLFPGELRDLKEGILHWKPMTKPLKEVKRRLEPMAGRQARLYPPSFPSSPTVISQSEHGNTSVTTSKNVATDLKRDW
ncbi:hypothetical protein L204_102582 [Cryptococcus depauperatus]